MSGRDVIGIAQTGTGKTAAFALPILHRLAANPRTSGTQSLPRAGAQPDARIVGANPRQLPRLWPSPAATQRACDRRRIDGRAGSRAAQRRRCPGRHAWPAARSRAEAMRFASATSNASCSTKPTACSTWASSTTSVKIVAKLPANRQTLMFSATMPRAIAELAAQMLRDPVKVAVTPEVTTAEKVEQRVIRVDRAAKPRCSSTCCGARRSTAR